MIPPSYSDLGKSARDLFSKGYNYGFYKLEAKTKTDVGAEFTSNLNSSHDSGKVNGSLETKYKCSEYGLTFKEKWTTDNVLSVDVSFEDLFTKGLKLSFDTSFAPQTGKKDGKMKLGYKTDYVNLESDVNFDFAGPTIHGNGVLGYNGWLAGAQLSFDTSKSKLTKSNFAVGYSKDGLTLHSNIDDGARFCGSAYQKVSDDLEVGANISYSAGNNNTGFGLGCKYIVDKDASVTAKVNNSSQIGLGYTQKVRDGVKLNFSLLLEGKTFSQGGHKVGFGLDIDV